MSIQPLVRAYLSSLLEQSRAAVRLLPAAASPHPPAHRRQALSGSRSPSPLASFLPRLGHQRCPSLGQSGSPPSALRAAALDPSSPFSRVRPRTCPCSRCSPSDLRYFVADESSPTLALPVAAPHLLLDVCSQTQEEGKQDGASAAMTARDPSSRGCRRRAADSRSRPAPLAPHPQLASIRLASFIYSIFGTVQLPGATVEHARQRPSSYRRRRPHHAR